MTDSHDDTQRWYEGISRYQWLVLIIASLGWVFDVFEGQIFVASMNEAMPSLVGKNTDPGKIDLYNQIALGAFLVGGALGGVLFGSLSDRIGRKKTMTLTIIVYSLFTCVSAFSQEWWHLAGFRLLVAMGVGGEWAVASALVAEEVPKRARARMLGIFHASSVLGTYLAVAAGVFVIGNPLFQSETYPTMPWRIGFLLGVLPAFLIIWIRKSLHEPASWQQAQIRSAEDSTQRTGRIRDLFGSALWQRTVVGVGLATVGLATFWGAHIYGKDILRRDIEHDLLTQTMPANAVSALSTEDRNAALKPYSAKLKNWEMLGMFLVTTGGGLGLLAFGPLCETIGRRGSFLLFHLGGFAASIVLFQFVSGVDMVMLALPVFGFLTLGMHAGYAVYFPELFPTRLRGTGAGFCFNFGRILAAPILFIRGLMRSPVTDGGFGLSLENAASILSALFLVGIVLLIFAPETKGQELPE